MRPPRRIAGIPKEAPAQIASSAVVRPQRITGGVRNDVMCEASGDSLAIAISDDAGGTGIPGWTWTITVYVMIPGGQFQLGQVRPASPGDAQSNPIARIAAFATCPGARQWMISLFSADPNAVADVTLSPSPYPCGLAGVITNIAGTIP
jgi:hypothetical protein